MDALTGTDGGERRLGSVIARQAGKSPTTARVLNSTAVTAPKPTLGGRFGTVAKNTAGGTLAGLAAGLGYDAFGGEVQHQLGDLAKSWSGSRDFGVSNAAGKVWYGLGAPTSAVSGQ